jgi:hypothetical protein
MEGDSPASQVIEPAAGLFLLPANISKEGDVFAQTNFTINAPQLCLLN